MARVFNTLMTKTLGYDSYVAQGGDWGGAISSWLGYEHAPACKAIHINILTMRHKDGPQTPEEHLWADQFEHDQIMEKRLPHTTGHKTPNPQLCDDGTAQLVLRHGFWKR